MSHIIETQSGLVEGTPDLNLGCIKFLGIPYAEPPVGALRFQPPAPVKPWAGVKSCTNFGHAAPQFYEPSEGQRHEFTDDTAHPDQKWVGHEDCLTLNIWTPTSKTPPKRVIVWIHGGANWLESSRLDTYHGHNFVTRGDVIFVSLNYRLGIFGFIDVSIIDGTNTKDAHVNGLKDQLLALQWVKNNIAAFGGDPENITVMGESAGSIDLSWLLVNGHLNGLVKQVVLMSGSTGLIGLSSGLGSDMSLELIQKKSRSLLNKLALHSASDLNGTSTEEIMDRFVHVTEKSNILLEMDSLFWPVKTPDFIPQDPLDPSAAANVSGINVMIGHTTYEMGLWLTWDDALDRQPFTKSAERLVFFDPHLADDARAVYQSALPNEAEEILGMHLIGDSIFSIPSYWLADKLTRQGVPVWFYQFDWEKDTRFKAQHAADQCFFFGNLDTHVGKYLTGEPDSQDIKKKRQSLSHYMMDTLLTFSAIGKPDKTKIWPAYCEKDRAVMSFNYDSTIALDPILQRRRWWYENIYSKFYA